MAMIPIIVGTTGLNSCKKDKKIIEITEYPSDAPNLKIKKHNEYDEKNRRIFSEHKYYEKENNGEYHYNWGIKEEKTYKDNYQEIKVSHDRNGDHIWESEFKYILKK